MTQGITILSRLFWPNQFGGLEHVLWRLSNALCDQGVPITVLAEASKADAETGCGTQQPRPEMRIIRQSSIEFGRLWRVGELVQIRWWMKALKQAPPSDIIWANEPAGAIAAILAGHKNRLLYRPVFCYDALHRVAHAHPEMRSLDRTRLSRWLDRRAYRRAQWVIDESDNLAQQHTLHYGPRERRHIIPNGTEPTSRLDCTRSQFDLTPEDFVVGFVGRPGDPCKDLPFLIKALQQVPHDVPIHLLIAGGGQGIDVAKKWVIDAGLESRCHWTGQLEDATIAYRAMDILVLPSRFETFGNVIIEAMTHGVPAIGRRRDDGIASGLLPILTASEQLIDHGVTGLTVDPHDPSDMAKAICRLAGNRETTRAMGKAARLANTADWHDTAAKYLDLLGIPSQPPSPSTVSLRSAI